MCSALRQTLGRALERFHDRANNEALSKKAGWAYKRQRGSKKFVDMDVTELQ